MLGRSREGCAPRRSLWVSVACLAAVSSQLAVTAGAAAAAAAAGPLASGGDRNNWAVLVDTSRYWYNYRHVSNVLTFYHTVKRMGIPDSQIILMLAEDMACNPRNAQPGTIFNSMHHGVNLYGEHVEVDYRGNEVSVSNFIRLLTGRHPPNTPRNKRLLTDSMSNVFVFATGHSGDEFIKFQDWEEITSTDIADAFEQMHKQRRYRRIFWISDTCQAATLQNQFYSPEIIGIGSSGKKENSYSHHIDHELGVAVVDRFSFHSNEFMRGLTTSSRHTVSDYMNWFDPRDLHSTPTMREDLSTVKASETLMSEFWASTGRMRFLNSSLRLVGPPKSADGAPRSTCAVRGRSADGDSGAEARYMAHTIRSASRYDKREDLDVAGIASLFSGPSRTTGHRRTSEALASGDTADLGAAQAPRWKLEELDPTVGLWLGAFAIGSLTFSKVL